MQMTCEIVGFMAGAIGGKRHNEMFGQQSLDKLVCGELNEWEKNKYVRDGTSTLRGVRGAQIGMNPSMSPLFTLRGFAWVVYSILNNGGSMGLFQILP